MQGGRFRIQDLGCGGFVSIEWGRRLLGLSHDLPLGLSSGRGPQQACSNRCRGFRFPILLASLCLVLVPGMRNL